MSKKLEVGTSETSRASQFKRRIARMFLLPIAAVLAVSAFSFVTDTAPAGASTTISLSDPQHLITRVGTSTTCTNDGLQAWATVYSAAGTQPVWIHAYYTQWTWTGSQWLQRGWAWMNGGNYIKTITIPYGMDEIAVSSVPSGYVYTVTYDVYVMDRSQTYWLAAGRFQGSVGEYTKNITGLSTAYCAV